MDLVLTPPLHVSNRKEGDGGFLNVMLVCFGDEGREGGRERKNKERKKKLYIYSGKNSKEII